MCAPIELARNINSETIKLMRANQRLWASPEYSYPPLLIVGDGEAFSVWMDTINIERRNFFLFALRICLENVFLWCECRMMLLFAMKLSTWVSFFRHSIVLLSGCSFGVLNSMSPTGKVLSWAYCFCIIMDIAIFISPMDELTFVEGLVFRISRHLAILFSVFVYYCMNIILKPNFQKCQMIMKCILKTNVAART